MECFAKLLDALTVVRSDIKYNQVCAMSKYTLRVADRVSADLEAVDHKSDFSEQGVHNRRNDRDPLL
jgi:hypothetical protein